MSLNRRQAMQLVAALPALAHGRTGGAADGPSPSPPSRPNILVIVLDDVGYSDLGPYGSEIPTPAIDALAARGACFTNFHVAPLCSPTRASLLTGCNPHRAGVGTIADWATDAPGYRGTVDRRLPMLPALLSPLGYGCYASGKWHLTSLRDQGPAGPYDDWPTRRGFDRWYGFQGFNADQFHPELFENTAPADRELPDDYHLTGDLVDHMIAMLAGHRSAAPDRPFFGYLALGACHWPLQVPAAMIATMRGRYDAGWSAVRDARFRRQLASGMLPPNTALPPENAGVPAWASLTDAERRFAARGQEVYAAFLAHADRELARLFAALDGMGVSDDTMILLLSDNGATAEGGKLGMADARRAFAIGPEDDAERAALLPKLGSDETFPAYPLGWAEASNTPLKWYKSNTHEGGVRTPLIISWPAGRVAPGWRSQYHHVSDVVPTILEVLGREQPGLDGSSLLYALRDPAAATRKQVQVFECVGSRALWLDGWKAVTRHAGGGTFDRDRWELYHAAEDFSEAHDLADLQPARLRALKERWFIEAERGQILPLNDRRMGNERANWPAQRSRYAFYPRARIDRLAVPDPARAQRITADVVVAAGARGVLVALGGAMRGYELFIDDGAACFVWRVDHATIVTTRSARLPAGRRTIEVELGSDRPRRSVRLLVDGREMASNRLPPSFPMASLSAGLRCGWNPHAPISRAYRGSNPFTGTLHGVVFTMDVPMTNQALAPTPSPGSAGRP